MYLVCDLPLLRFNYILFSKVQVNEYLVLSFFVPNLFFFMKVLNRLTFASTLSHLRRVNSPIGRDGKLAKPRQLHNTLWGMVPFCFHGSYEVHVYLLCICLISPMKLIFIFRNGVSC